MKLILFSVHLSLIWFLSRTWGIVNLSARDTDIESHVFRIQVRSGLLFCKILANACMTNEGFFPPTKIHAYE